MKFKNKMIKINLFIKIVFKYFIFYMNILEILEDIKLVYIKLMHIC